MVRDHGTVALEDIFTGETPAIGAAAYVAGPLNLLLRNDRQPVQIEGVELTIDSFEEPRTATIERVWLDDARAERRRRRSHVHILTRSYRGVERTHTPAAARFRRTRAARCRLSSPTARGWRRSSSATTASRATPRASTQMIRVFNRARRNNRIYVKLVASAPGAVVNGEQLSALPPSVLAVHRRRPAGRQRAAARQARCSASGSSPPIRPSTGQRTLAVAARERRSAAVVPGDPSPHRLRRRPAPAPVPHHAHPVTACLRAAPRVLAAPRSSALSRSVPRRLDAASTSFWLVSTQAEFLKGEVERCRSTATAASRSGPALETVHDVGSPAVWRLLADGDDTLWAGTGNDGKVWKVDAGRQGAVAFDAAELEVHALAPAPSGGVYAALLARRQGLPRRRATASSTPFFDPEDKYIWSLARGARRHALRRHGREGPHLQGRSPTDAGQRLLRHRDDARHALVA